MAAPAAATAPLALLLELAIVVTALVGVVRIAGLRALSDDPRLRRLSWFFGLFAAAVGVQVLLTTLLLGKAPQAGPGLVLLRLARLTLLEHGLMLAAFVVALRAFATPWKAAAPVAASLLLAPRLGLAWLMGLVESLLALYLAIASVVNQRHRRTRGSLRVAAGFALFFLGHLSFWAFAKTGAVRPFWAEALTLASIALLVAAVPRAKKLPTGPAGGAA
jgi:hypothetical protein